MRRLRITESCVPPGQRAEQTPVSCSCSVDTDTHQLDVSSLSVFSLYESPRYVQVTLLASFWHASLASPGPELDRLPETAFNLKASASTQLANCIWFEFLWFQFDTVASLRAYLSPLVTRLYHAINLPSVLLSYLVNLNIHTCPKLEDACSC